MRAPAEEIERDIWSFFDDYAKERGIFLPSPDAIDGASTLSEIGFDSLDQVAMVTDLERVFDLEIEDELLGKDLTVDALLSIVSAAIHAKPLSRPPLLSDREDR